jgi:transposase
MANYIKMTVKNAIVALHKQKWAKRRIARELGVDPKTVRRYVGLEEKSEPAISTPGADSKSPISTPGTAPSKPAISPPGVQGRRSLCEPHHDRIVEWLEQELNGQRIWQDLRDEYGFEGSYQSVKRYIHKLGKSHPDLIERLECPPGEEAQVDFGAGAWVIGDDRRRRRPHVFRITLSFSRKGYSEVVWRQNTESFIRALENAFRAFGGVPQTLCIDNLKAAVTRADWYDPELHPKITSFCEHYGTVILPTRPYTPRHKGKIESGIKYVKNNALKGRVFRSLAEQNEFLRHWEASVADGRIHGTTRQQVRKLFEEREKEALKPLPGGLFPLYQEAPRSVHRDGYVEVAKAYYKVPPEHIGHKVWVRWDDRLVRIYDRNFEPIRTLARKPPGTFSDALGPRGRSICMERELAFWIRRAMKMGDHCGQWAVDLIGQRGEQGIRVIQGLRDLGRKHSWSRIDEVCRLAVDQSAYRLRDLRRLLDEPTTQENFQFMQQHPLIRDMSEYSAFLDAVYPEEETIKEVVHE